MLKASIQAPRIPRREQASIPAVAFGLIIALVVCGSIAWCGFLWRAVWAMLGWVIG